eukprot:4616059-Prymnesium_polylepis.1
MRGGGVGAFGTFCGLWDLELGDSVGCPLDPELGAPPPCYRAWCFVDPSECQLNDVASSGRARTDRAAWHRPSPFD